LQKYGFHHQNYEFFGKLKCKSDGSFRFSKAILRASKKCINHHWQK